MSEQNSDLFCSPPRIAVDNSNPKDVKVEVNALEPKVTIFPNPNQGSITVNVNEDLNSGKYEIFDFQGKRLLFGTISGKSSKLDIKELPKGNFIIRIATDKFEHSDTIIRE